MPINKIQSAAFEDLTDRENEIIDLIMQGQTNHEIALALSLAYETIKWYTKRIYSKLHVDNRTQLILLMQEANTPLLHTPHTLPRTLTQFIGRQQEIQDIAHVLQQERLVTVVGAGGVGKTRLAVEVGTRQAPQQHVLFIPLDAVDTQEQFIGLLSNAFGIVQSGSGGLLHHLLSALPTHPTLLILDNFETVVESAGILAQILQHSDHLRLLVTSRVVLRLQTEYVYFLRGLPVEDTTATNQSAIDLFLERAHHQQSTTDTISERQIIAEICALVDGNPLAIELAASWTRTLTYDQILQELQHGLDLLQVDLQDVDDRHRSMVAVCEQSWGMLTEDEQRICMGLSVFRGGFSSEAAHAITDVSHLHLANLVDKSMVRPTDDNRFQFHDILRMFARSQLAKQPALSQDIHQRHARYFITFLAESEAMLRSWKQKQVLQVIELELDNIVEAWQWIVRHGDIDELALAMQPLARFLSNTDRSQQGATLFAQALEQATAGTRTYAGLLLFKGWNAIWLGQTIQGETELFAALDLLDQLGVSAEWAMPTAMITFNEGYDSDTFEKLYTHYKRDREIYIERGEDWNIGWMEYSLGNICRATNRYKESVTYLQSSFQHFEEVGDLYCQAWALDGLSTTYRRMKAYDRAVETGLQLKAISERISYNVGLVISHELFGEVAVAHGNHQEAYTHFHTALRHALSNADPTTIIPMILHLAKIIATQSTLPQHIAAEMFAIVKAHTASQQDWFAFRHQEASEWLKKLQNTASDEGYYAAIIRGQSSNLIGSARHLLHHVLPESI